MLVGERRAQRPNRRSGQSLGKAGRRKQPRGGRSTVSIWPRAFRWGRPAPAGCVATGRGARLPARLPTPLVTLPRSLGTHRKR